jgi:hypothetical protein
LPRRHYQKDYFEEKLFESIGVKDVRSMGFQADCRNCLKAFTLNTGLYNEKKLRIIYFLRRSRFNDSGVFPAANFCG